MRGPDPVRTVAASVPPVSQRSCLEVAAESEGHTLILEDDAWFVDGFAGMLKIAVQFLPENVGWYYLGGQHLKVGENLPVELVSQAGFRW